MEVGHWEDLKNSNCFGWKGRVQFPVLGGRKTPTGICHLVFSWSKKNLYIYIFSRHWVILKVYICPVECNTKLCSWFMYRYMKLYTYDYICIYIYIYKISYRYTAVPLSKSAIFDLVLMRGDNSYIRMPNNCTPKHCQRYPRLSRPKVSGWKEL